DGVSACCVGLEDELVVVVEAADHREHLQATVADRCALPHRSVRVCVVVELPRLASGKPDLRAVAEIATQPVIEPEPAPTGDLTALYAEILNRTDVTPDSTFVSLGGDSLSYVEMSLRLEQALGRLPASWHTTTIRELSAAAPRPARRRRPLDTSVALRAVAIVLIVASHIGVFTVRGGAHVLLAVAGFNFARFHLTDVTRRTRVRHLLISVARVAVPSAVFLGALVLVDPDYSWSNALLLNEAIGPRHGDQRNFWFVETLVYTLLALTAVLALPLLDRWERRLPFALPMALLAAALTVRYDVIALSTDDNLTTPAALFWLFAIGWAAGKAQRTWQRGLVAAVALVSVSGYFTNSLRTVVVMVGLSALVWLPSLPSTALLNRLAGVLAGSSLYIYLTHWAVYPLLDDYSGVLALLTSLLVGVLYATAVQRLSALLPRLRRPKTSDRAEVRQRTHRIQPQPQEVRLC
ncbi:MAG TPA: acyltransferase family protein, partial [Actinoplanes sp.]|nr:acyltransferase family protein [Actinoplanes sp.]